MTARERAIRHEELLANLGWVQGLALRLMRDAGLAEDVAQETMARALERPPRTAHSGAPLRAFLATLTRLLARDRHRSDTRRARRERAGARAETLPSTLDVVERNALLQRVAEQVSRLDEPYRSTVLLRYLDGLDTNAIAEHTGASPPTVRKRLSRGLAELRARLRAEFGEAECWTPALLLPFLGESTMLTKKALVGGGLLMATEMKIAVGLVLVAGSVIAVQRSLPRGAVELEPLPAVFAQAPDPGLRALGYGSPILAGVQEPSRAIPESIAEPAEDHVRGDLASLDLGLGLGLRVPSHAAMFTGHFDNVVVCEAAKMQPLDLTSCVTCHGAEVPRATPPVPLDGSHTKFHANGIPAAQGSVRNGARSGTWTKWYDDGSFGAQGEYYAGDQHGWWSYRQANGEKQAEGQFLYNRREGLWNEYHQDGTRKRVASFRKGELSGLERTWHAGGKVLASEVDHYAGLAEGSARTWYQNGQAESRGHYLRGKPVGIWHYWHPDGTPDESRSAEAATQQ